MRCLFIGLLCAAFLAPLSWGQKVTGRSPNGSLGLVLPADSAGAPAPVRTRVITYDYEFSEPSGNKFLDPKETGRLRIVLTNSGKSTARNLVVRVVPLAPPTDISFNDSITVGDIPVSATRYAIFYFSASENVPSQVLTFQIDIHDPHGSVADSRLFTFLTRERRAR